MSGTGGVIQRVIELKDNFSPTMQKVNKGTVQYKRDLRDLQRAGRRSFNALKKGMIAVSGAAVGLGAGMAALATKTASTAEEIDNASSKAGVHTTKLQELRYAMDRIGVKNEDLQQALERTNRRYGEAVQEGGKYKDALDKMNVSLEDAEGNMRSTDDVFKDAIQNLHEMESSQKASALATDFFGENLASKLLPAIEKGGEEMEKLMEEAHEFGHVMDEEAIQKGQKFNEQLDRLKSVGTGAMRHLGTIALPWVTKGLEWVLERVSTVREYGVAAFDRVSEAVEDNREKFDAVRGAIADVRDNIIGAFSPEGDGGSAVQWISDVGVPKVVSGIGSILETAAGTYYFFRDNWSLIGPIIYGIVGAMTAYYAISKALIVKKHAMTAAQWAYNAAMGANPIGAVVLGIGALIAIGTLLIKNKENVALAGKKAWNTIVDAVEWGVNKYIGAVDFLAEKVIAGFNYFGEKSHGAMTRFAGAVIDSAEWMSNQVINRINNMSEVALKGINGLIKAANKVPGINIDPIEFSGIKEADFGAVKDMVPDFDPLEYTGVGEVDLGTARFDTEGREFQWGGADEEDDDEAQKFEAALKDHEKKEEENVKMQKESQDNLAKELKENTETLERTKGGGNNIEINVIGSDLTAEEIANKLVPKLERELFA